MKREIVVQGYDVRRQPAKVVARGDDRTPIRRGIALSIVLLHLLSLPACNPFRTGAPENPEGPQIDYPPPTTTDNVLKILAMALGAKDNRAYLERLSVDFAFRPDPVQLPTAEFQKFPSTWSRDQEAFFLAALFSNLDSVAVEWQDILTQPQGTGAEVTARYTLTAFRTGQSETRYTGQARFFMEQVAGVWNVRGWDDVVLSNVSQTWGLLRAQVFAT